MNPDAFTSSLLSFNETFQCTPNLRYWERVKNHKVKMVVEKEVEELSKDSAIEAQLYHEEVQASMDQHLRFESGMHENFVKMWIEFVPAARYRKESINSVKMF
jgi:hypothetical protein